jgi:hypothetical protein
MMFEKKLHPFFQRYPPGFPYPLSNMSCELSNTISDTIMQCEECEYTFQSENPNEICPECGEKANITELTEHQTEQLVERIREDRDDHDDENEEYQILRNLYWFTPTKENFQACWRALKSFSESNDHEDIEGIENIEDIISMMNFLENEFPKVPSQRESDAHELMMMEKFAEDYSTYASYSYC